jgi:hypothetical protein
VNHEIEIQPDGPFALLTIRDPNGMEWSIGAQLGDEAVGVAGNRRPVGLVITPGSSLLEIKVIKPSGQR